MCNEEQTQEGATDDNQAPRVPLASVGNRPFRAQGRPLFACSDYFSQYLEVVKLTTTTSTSFIRALKMIFSRYGIPEVLHSDSSPQYASKEFEEFAKSYRFRHETSSPLYPQSNGLAECV